MTNLQNGSRIANITATRDGEFRAFIGFTEDRNICPSGMQVVDFRTYKRESAAIKFCTNWINS